LFALRGLLRTRGVSACETSTGAFSTIEAAAVLVVVVVDNFFDSNPFISDSDSEIIAAVGVVEETSSYPMVFRFCVSHHESAAFLAFSYLNLTSPPLHIVPNAASQKVKNGWEKLVLMPQD
jgi:hypothetical protein